MSYWAKAHRTFASYYSCSCLCFLLLSECIKCYESAGVRRQTERERDIEWKQRKSRQIAEAKTIWVGEKNPTNGRRLVYGACKHTMRRQNSIRRCFFFFLANIQHDRPPMPSTTIVRRRPIAHRANITYLYSCWLVHFWSIKFYILPSGLNRKRLIMVRQCQNIKSGIYKDYFPFSFTEHGI